MNLPQARKRMTRLGFAMSQVQGVPNWGRRELTEVFDFAPNHVLSVPYRDVYIGTASNGWYITSSIHFRGRLYRQRKWNDRQMERRNVFGMGATLAEAVADFERNFYRNEQLHAKA